MILIKEKEIMERGKKIIKDFLQKFSNLKSLQNLSNLEKRIASSLFLIPIILCGIFLSESLFLLLILIIAILSAFEWKDMTKIAENQNKWTLIGIFYLVIPF
jgi:predicted CDP-diglyceride synthetase/phosphatidate cytidylyltransferase